MHQPRLFPTRPERARGAIRQSRLRLIETLAAPGIGRVYPEERSKGWRLLFWYSWPPSPHRFTPTRVSAVGATKVHPDFGSEVVDTAGFLTS